MDQPTVVPAAGDETPGWLWVGELNCMEEVTVVTSGVMWSLGERAYDPLLCTLLVLFYLMGRFYF